MGCEIKIVLIELLFPHVFLKVSFHLISFKCMSHLHDMFTHLNNALFSQSGDRRHKSTVQYASRPDLPKLAYRKVKGKSPGVVFLPGYGSNMNGQKAEALEEFCRSLGHSCLR